jgi:hypothetical protein
MRRFLSSACFSLGTVWAAAGILKLLFGVRLTLPLLPPFGLEQIAIVPSLLTGLVLFAIGALLGRAVDAPGARMSDDTSLETDALLREPFAPVTTSIRPSIRQPNER